MLDWYRNLNALPIAGAALNKSNEYIDNNFLKEPLTNVLISHFYLVHLKLKTICQNYYHDHVTPFRANPTKWPNELKQFVSCCQQIVWVCLTLLRGCCLKFECLCLWNKDFYLAKILNVFVAVLRYIETSIPHKKIIL